MNRLYFISLCLVLALIAPRGSSAQCVEGDCKNGYGSYVYPSGAIYTGQFMNGLIHGRGELEFSNGDIYRGEWVRHYREGEGEMIFANGDHYRGEFEQSQLSGKGIMNYGNGDQYDGQWLEDKPQGKGSYKFHHGARYVGSFSKGQFHGYGVYYFKDGVRYEGEWYYNKKHGVGITYHLDGLSDLSRWKYGEEIIDEPSTDPVVSTEELITDDGSLSDINTVLSDCNRVHCAEGQGSYNYIDGSRYEGDFLNGLPNGEGVCQYANGDRYVGGWLHHTPHGEGVMYFHDGQVFGAQWNNGKPIRELDLEQSIELREDIEIQHTTETKIWAVIVGVSRYAHMPALKYTDDDAYRMYAFLKSPEGGALSDDQMSLLIDDRATRQEILDEMQNIFLKADDNDMILLYYSGHGLEGSFLPIDFNGYENKIHYSEVKSILDKSQAKHKVCIADACHSGSLSSAKGDKKKPIINRLYDGLASSSSSTAFLMSSADQELSLEGSVIRQGVFTHFLLRGLKGEADQNGDLTVTLQELYDYVHHAVREYTDRAQTPKISGQYDRDMPLSMLRTKS